MEDFDEASIAGQKWPVHVSGRYHGLFCAGLPLASEMKDKKDTRYVCHQL